MSTKHAPTHSAPDRAARRRQVRGFVPGLRRDKPAPPPPETWGQRFKHFFPSAAAPLLVLALAVVAGCFAVILIGGWRLAYLPAAIGQTWLSFNAAPLRIDGVVLDAVPLLPAVGVVALVANRIRAATRERVTVLDLAAVAALTALVSLTLSAIALFMVSDASHVFAIEAPNPAAALLAPLGVHLAGFVFGIAPAVWRALAAKVGVPELAVDAAVSATRILRDFLLGGLAVFLVLLAVNYQRVAEAVAAFPTLGWGGGLALTLLCVAYLPNAAVATLSVLLGGSVEYAGGAVSLFDVTAVPLPPLPILAAVPAEVPQWAPVLMLVPAALVLRFALRKSFSLLDATATATWAALFALILGVYAGGTAGAYGHVGANPWTLALLAFLWTFVAGLLTWLVSVVRSRRTEGGAIDSQA